MFDQMVATTFANVAMDLIRDGVSGRLVGIQGGRYAHAPLPDPKLGPRTVDVASLYNADRYRPNYSAKLGQPLLLSAVAG
jgi:6-phosphofructokinase 1